MSRADRSAQPSRMTDADIRRQREALALWEARRARGIRNERIWRALAALAGVVLAVMLGYAV